MHRKLWAHLLTEASRKCYGLVDIWIVNHGWFLCVHGIVLWVSYIKFWWIHAMDCFYLYTLRFTSMVPEVLRLPQWNNSEAWWHHQMGTFSALVAICLGKSLVPDKFHAQRPVTWSFDVFFDLRLNKRLSKQSWGWWFETLSSSLWRHCNGFL